MVKPAIVCTTGSTDSDEERFSKEKKECSHCYTVIITCKDDPAVNVSRNQYVLMV